MRRSPILLLAALPGLALLLACGPGLQDSTTTTSGGTTATGWTGPVALETDLTQSSVKPSVGVDGSNNAFVAWTRATASGNNAVWGAAYQYGSGWHAAGAASTLAGSLQDVAAGASSSGVYLFAYDDTQSRFASDSAVYVSGWSTSAGLGNAVQLSPGNYGYGPSVAEDPSGTACVAWTEADGAYSTIMASVLNTSTGDFTSAQTLSQDASANAAHPLAATDANGNVVVLWREAVDDATGPWTLKAAAGLAATGWTAPVAVQAGSGPADSSYALAMGAPGAVAAWSESTDGGATYQIYARLFEPSSAAWSPALRVSATGVNAFAPSVALDAAGTVVLAWSQGATSASGWAGRCPPSSRRPRAGTPPSRRRRWARRDMGPWPGSRRIPPA